jgi:hypothetical protein
VERLEWQRNPAGGFVAHPEGVEHPDCRAIIWLGVHLSPDHQWQWAAGWSKRFQYSGMAPTKQAAADAATEAWWRGKAMPIPRDIDGEIEAILDAILSKPPAPDLLGEDSGYLRRLMHLARARWEVDMIRETVPVQVKELMAALSQELYRRRIGG